MPRKDPNEIYVMNRSAGKPPVQFLSYPELQQPINAEWSARLRRTLAAQAEDVRTAISEPDGLLDELDKGKLREWLNRAEKRIAELDGGRQELDDESAMQAKAAAARVALLAGAGDWTNVGNGEKSTRSNVDTGVNIRLMPSDGTINELLSQYGAHRSGGAFHEGQAHVRTLIDSGDVSPRPVAGAAPDRYAEPRTIPGVLGMRPETSLAGGMAYLQVGATPAESPTAEGANKPEWNNLAGDSLVPVTLARWSEFTRQAFESHADFRRALFYGHARGIAKDVDALFVAALVTAAGSPLALGSGDGSIRGAIARVEDAISTSPDLIVISVDDYENYSFDATNASDVNSRITSIAGVPVYVTSALISGSVLVANVRSGAYVTTGPVESVVRDQNLRQNTMEARTEVALNYKPSLLGAVVLLADGS